MEKKIKLLRIYFRKINITQEEENELLYFYHQISLLISSELNKILINPIDTIRITFGTKDLWLKYYKEEDIPHYHWYKKTGSASVIFD